MSPRQHTPLVVDPVGDRRSTWWVLAELGRRLGHELALVSGDDVTDDAVLTKLASRGRCTFDELVANGWVETPHELPAQWVEDHLDRLGGWRLAPELLVDQLAEIEIESSSLVLVPRRQVRHLNSQLDFLGEVVEVIVHPDDAAAAGVADGEPVVVRSAQGELTGVAKVDRSVRVGVVSVPHGHQGANVNLLTEQGSDRPADRHDAVLGRSRHPAPGVERFVVREGRGGSVACLDSVRGDHQDLSKAKILSSSRDWSGGKRPWLRVVRAPLVGSVRSSARSPLRPRS